VVPLNINKLDLRDYLKHGYGVEVLNVRSFITQRKIQRTKPGTTGIHYYRPRSIKKMTVELVEPFVYPSEPTDLSPYVLPFSGVRRGKERGRDKWRLLTWARWDNELWKALEKVRDDQQKKLGPFSYKEANIDRNKLRNLANEVLGEETTEVEKDIPVRWVSMGNPV
jgi:large subunit ribosomal protein L23